jgi:hypothetical protein
MILLHGRGASAEDILSLAQAFAQPEIDECGADRPGWDIEDLFGIVARHSGILGL